MLDRRRRRRRGTGRFWRDAARRVGERDIGRRGLPGREMFVGDDQELQGVRGVSEGDEVAEQRGHFTPGYGVGGLILGRGPVQAV